MDIIVNANVSTTWETHLKINLHDEISNYYQNILICLGYASDAPVADLLRQYHKLDGHWLIASPIHWQATHNDAVITACDEALDLSDNESRRWFSALERFLAHEKVKLHYHDAYTWLIQWPESPPIHAMPVHQLLQRSMMSQLHALDETLFWSRFLTENQMFFSEHVLNKARVGRYPINGLWVWGDGELGARGSRPIVSCDEAGYDLASLLTTNVVRYVPGYKCPKNAMLLLSDFDERQAFQFGKNTIHWYWNNATYMTKPKRWLEGLFAKMTTKKHPSGEYVE